MTKIVRIHSSFLAKLYRHSRVPKEDAYLCTIFHQLFEEVKKANRSSQRDKSMVNLSGTPGSLRVLLGKGT